MGDLASRVKRSVNVVEGNGVEKGSSDNSVLVDEALVKE